MANVWAAVGGEDRRRSSREDIHYGKETSEPSELRSQLTLSL